MTELTAALLIFLGVSVFFIFFHLMMGKMIRPSRPDADKLTIYECGEPTIGSAWIQFDLRFYVVALLFVIFDVEVVFFFPWAVVFGKANALAHEDQPARQQLTSELIPVEQQAAIKSGGEGKLLISAQSARQLAWMSFWDILFFFGILLVGFAYLWKRGDLDWVRSTAAEKISAGAPVRGSPSVENLAVAAGRH